MDSRSTIRAAVIAVCCLFALLCLGALAFAPPSWMVSLGCVGMAVGTYGVSLAAGGVSMQRAIMRTGDGQLGLEIALPAGKTVTSWVDTDSNTAACNLPAGHGYADGNFDVYWSSGGVNYCRRNVPGTISTNALSLDGGAGDSFPATATSGIVVCRQVAWTGLIDGDNCKIVGVSAEISATVTTRQHVSFLDASSSQVTYLVVNANEPVVTDITGGATNIFTGNVITNGVASNGDPTNAATLKIIAVYDATP